MTQSSKRYRQLLNAVSLVTPSIDDWSEIAKLTRLSTFDIELFLSPGASTMGRRAVAARLHGRIVAAVAWQSAFDAAAPSARLLAICVDPLFRGLGLARLLVAHMEREAARGASMVVASTDMATADCLRHLGYDFVGYDKGQASDDRPAAIFHVSKTLHPHVVTRLARQQPDTAPSPKIIAPPPIPTAIASTAERVLALPLKSMRPGTRRTPAKPLH